MKPKRRFGICLLVGLIFVSLTGQAFAGSIVGWGEQVVGGDLSGGFVKVAAGSQHSLGLKQDGSIVT